MSKQSDLRTSDSGTDCPDSAPNPIDPARLRLSQDFTTEAGVKKALVRIPVRKPAREWFVRVHADEAYRLETAVLELKDSDDRDMYLIAPELRSELAHEPTFGLRALFTAMTRQGVLFIWPVALPGPDGRENPWHQSLAEAARMAKTGWVRVAANMNLGAYDVWEAQAVLPEPEWPEKPFAELLQTAFKNRYIDSLDHPVLQQLQGKV